VDKNISDKAPPLFRVEPEDGNSIILRNVDPPTAFP